jgi:DNA-directed RNA polymerase specialized sigma24 family protein
MQVARDRQLVLDFHDGEGLSFQAIAAKLGKPVQGVASLYCSAKLAAVQQEVAS